MTIKLKGALVALALIAAPSQAAVYDLSLDFSDVTNPNGTWSYGPGLSHHPQPITPNALNGAAANGFWGAGVDFFAAPFLLKATANGSAVGYLDTDFLAGDVLVHGPNDGSPVLINWTAPADGLIDLTASLWYAHSPVLRSQDIVVTLDGAGVASTAVSNGIGRGNAFSINAIGLSVSAGDVLSFAFSKTSGQTFGSLSGISATIDFTAKSGPGAVPEPASWAMMIGGFALAGGAMRRRRVALSFT